MAAKIIPHSSNLVQREMWLAPYSSRPCQKNAAALIIYFRPHGISCLTLVLHVAFVRCKAEACQSCRLTELLRMCRRLLMHTELKTRNFGCGTFSSCKHGRRALDKCIGGPQKCSGILGAFTWPTRHSSRYLLTSDVTHTGTMNRCKWL